MIVIFGKDKTPVEAACLAIRKVIQDGMLRWVERAESAEQNSWCLSSEREEEINLKIRIESATNSRLFSVLGGIHQYLNGNAAAKEEWSRYASLVLEEHKYNLKNVTNIPDMEAIREIDPQEYRSRVEDNCMNLGSIVSIMTVTRILGPLMEERGREKVLAYLKEESSANEFRNKNHMRSLDKPRGTHSDYLVTKEEEDSVVAHVRTITADLLKINGSP
tara:strand:+ start:753 stop:1409 length:657 start_codon:yes stop_codon:yes gene_type:complete